MAPVAAEAAASSVDRAESVLTAAGWSLGDVCRAWIHLSDAGEAGQGVGASERAVLDRMGRSDVDSLAFPATTSSAGRSLRGGQCALDLVAARPRSNVRFERRRLGDPRGATGLRLDAGEFRYVFVSATPSMDAAEAYPIAGDFRSQALEVLENVVALLASEGAGLDDIRQATAFVRRPADAEDFRCLAEVCGLWEVPVVAVRSEMCRDDLLFELDATAALPIQTTTPFGGDMTFRWTRHLRNPPASSGADGSNPRPSDGRAIRSAKTTIKTSPTRRDIRAAPCATGRTIPSFT